jgi:zinc transport system substrate-binding protein
MRRFSLRHRPNAVADLPCPEPVEGRTLVLQLVVLVIAILAASPAAAAPKVVASIKPLHSLIAGVMAGVGEPELIVAGAASPHTYALKPSDARRLQAADLVVWIGPIMESFLVKPLAALAGKAEIVELDRAPGVRLLQAREGGAWEEEGHHRAERALEHDGHLWLDPENAKAIVALTVARLSARDPENAEHYAANGAAVARRLTALDDDLRRRLAPLKGAGFVVFHDAYQYFERRYELTAIGSITVSPERPPGARRLAAIHDKIASAGVRCVFSEPQFAPRLVETVIAGTGARGGVLDPEGGALPRGPQLYFSLMNGLADSLLHCLGEG